MTVGDTLQTGAGDLRAEHISKVVTGFALQSYVLKQLCMISSSNSWKETYFKESKTELTGGTSSPVTGVPRLAKFPYGEVTWTEAASRHQKFAMEGQLSWEDVKTNEIDVLARTFLRIGRAVAKAVDDHIWDILSETQAFTNANLLSITAGEEWDSATIANRDPIQNILDAQKEIVIDNYDIYRNGFLLLNPLDFANLMGNANVRNSGQFWTGDVTKNGRVGRMLGMTVIVSNSITADNAAIVISKTAMSFKQAAPLKVTTEYDNGVKYVVRAWEVGVAQQVNPEAICGIKNTTATT